VVGLQVNLPFSKRLSSPLILHLNAGWTFMPGVKESTPSGHRVNRDLTAYHGGGSLIWPVRYRFHLMLEYLTSVNGEIGADGEVSHSSETILNPGLRFAIDIRHLQIVPGIAIPLRFGPEGNHTGLFFYLSFEHPF
jgi:hypothetical protein